MVVLGCRSLVLVIIIIQLNTKKDKDSGTVVRISSQMGHKYGKSMTNVWGN